MKVIKNIVPETSGRWNAQSLLEDVKDHDVETINEACAFSKASSSLFRALCKCFHCNAEHMARLQLSTFNKGELEMVFGDDEDDAITASFFL